ncbi:MAG: hypothetical protein IJ379_11770 [Lachnospiraceae bacterium]|nr:hypothetical protein [Lachnospiraceae bacterium]
MHVAVCDDNIADRKQMERLLGRESDRRAKLTEGLYIDSYGNEKALLANPMQYDIFYIDMCKTEGIDGAQVATRLRDSGVRVPIYMCCSDMDYRKMDLPEDTFFLDKPIKPDMLIASLDQAYEVKQNAVPLIELREEKETLYVTEADIMYGVAEGKHVAVHLADGRIVKEASSVENLFDQWAHYETFLMPSFKYLLNGRYIESVGLLQLTMKDGTKFPIHGIWRGYAKDLLEKYKK